MILKTIAVNETAEVTVMIQDPSVSFRVYKKRPAVIICPGGAYLIHSTKEAEPVALDFLARGFHCFILRYTVAADREHPERGINRALRYPQPTLELMEVIHMIHQNAEAWFIEPDQIYMMGFSAGAHVCAAAGTRWNDPQLTARLSFVPDGQELKTAGMILGYPMLADNPDSFEGQEYRGLEKDSSALVKHVLYGTDTPSEAQKETVNLCSFVSEDTVPVFLWHSVDDPLIDVNQSTLFIQNCCRHHVPCEYHLFSRGGHGKGLANADKNEKGLPLWRDLAESWIWSLKGGRES